jgi:hypothetical protein
MNKNKKEASTAGKIVPQTPDTIAKLEWLRLHWKKHWKIILCAALILLAGSIVSTSWGVILLKNISTGLVNKKIESAVKDLRLRYPEVRDDLSSGSADFSDVEKAIKFILKLDPRNGHGLYYAGEVKRIKNQSLFTPKSCLIEEKFIGSPQSLDEYEDAFNRYIDIEKALPENERAGNYSAETCYQRVSGYCPQRTAWIHHLLANDLYVQAMSLINIHDRADKLQRALEHAHAAEKLYKDDQGQPGFGQCKATVALINEAEESLTSVK